MELRNHQHLLGWMNCVPRNRYALTIRARGLQRKVRAVLRCEAAPSGDGANVQEALSALVETARSASLPERMRSVDAPAPSDDFQPLFDWMDEIVRRSLYIRLRYEELAPIHTWSTSNRIWVDDVSDDVKVGACSQTVVETLRWLRSVWPDPKHSPPSR